MRRPPDGSLTSCSSLPLRSKMRAVWNSWRCDERARVGQVARVVRVQAHDAREAERAEEHHDGEKRQQQPHSVRSGSRSTACAGATDRSTFYERELRSAQNESHAASCDVSTRRRSARRSSTRPPRSRRERDPRRRAAASGARRTFAKARSSAPGSIIGAGVYVGAGVRLGRNCKIQNNALLYEGVELDDGVFVGPQVCFTNDFLPRAVNPDLSLKSRRRLARGPDAGARRRLGRRAERGGHRA